MEIMSKTQLFEEVLFNRGADGKLSPKHPKLKRVILGLVYSFAKKDTFKESELMGSAVTISWIALHDFKLADGADWNAVIDGRDRLNLNRIVKAIVTKIEHVLPVEANPNTKRMYDPETGGKMYVTINFDSIDRPMYDENGEVVGSVGDEVSESYFAPQGPTLSNPFVDWFRENRRDFLTRTQNDFIDRMSSMTLVKDTDYVEDNDFESIAGMKPRDLDRIKKRIRERTLKAWDEYRADKPQVTRRGEEIVNRVVDWAEFIAIAESDDNLADQNVMLSNWIKRNASDDDVEDVTDLIYDTLAGDRSATRTFVSFMKGERESIEAPVLYRIYEAIVDKVVRLKSEFDSLATVESTQQPINREARKANAERKRKYREFTEEQTCTVYNREGTLVRTMKSNMKEYKIVELNALGATHDTRDC
jgi:hypothetical protein